MTDITKDSLLIDRVEKHFKDRDAPLDLAAYINLYCASHTTFAADLEVSRQYLSRLIAKEWYVWRNTLCSKKHKIGNLRHPLECIIENSATDISEYIRTFYLSKSEFAEEMGVAPTQITRWIAAECFVYDGYIWVKHDSFENSSLKGWNKTFTLQSCDFFLPAK